MDFKTANQRVTDLRDEYARLGEDVTALPDTDLLSRELGRVHTEKRTIENAHSNLVADRAKWERSVRAAARRAVADDRIALGGMYLQQLVTRSAGRINEVLHQAAELPDGRASAEQTRALKEAAVRAKWLMSGLVGHGQGQFDEARQQNQAISLTEKQREEILRLRNLITTEGQRLHAESGGRGNRERCECAGCELIRSMDDVPQLAAAAA
ncbi:hypothetical protein ACFYPN_15795 [Streptomyces sp. NPDC005576]|uniref:hypothetical protein n=1 Tax=Streptomyces sp. NPDC005576 TaxID=3364726 RepID=UPI0036921B13